MSYVTTSLVRLKSYIVILVLLILRVPNNAKEPGPGQLCHKRFSNAANNTISALLSHSLVAWGTLAPLESCRFGPQTPEISQPGPAAISNVQVLLR